MAPFLILEGIGSCGGLPPDVILAAQVPLGAEDCSPDPA
ncbi:hypothetical protein Z949_1259 [Sulfitobacter guttiformis KCTC 32187]|nr:hypothetical protein Z949_1259 [Sulfitobacter guttiformis KCTC 32187]